MFLKLLGLAVLIGGIYLFINWEKYEDSVKNGVEIVDKAAEKSKDLRDKIKDSISK